jgi:hypothetical protein
MSWYRHHWQYVGLVLAVVSLAYLAIGWDSLDVRQRVLVASFVVLLLHEFEEWGWPGGEPAVLNKVIFNSGKPDRYPLNANSAMIVNVFAAYPLYVAAVIFSDAIWLGLLAAFLFWVAQFVFHGILTTKKLRYPYNPGLLSIVVGGLPLGAYYVYHVESSNLASVWDWLGAALVLVAFVVIVMLRMTFAWFADEDSPYRFTDAEMRKWNVDARLTRAAAR